MSATRPIRIDDGVSHVQCPYCYCVWGGWPRSENEHRWNSHIKGYEVECPNCKKMLHVTILK